MSSDGNAISPGNTHPLWLYIFLPAVTMLLGWGLRGFIGGGPFGAMIPGAMLMITICLLLEVPFATAGVMVVFATAGIGMGGEMTYGQTLGFLRKADSVWWGTCGTTVKGGVWGLVGGSFIGLGLIYRLVKPNTIMAGLLVFLVAFLAGLKLINDPKLIYFSDPINKPRQESWAGLLFGAIALLTWLKIKLEADQFKLVVRFAGYGLVGGALGFGLGALWISVGTILVKNSWISDWWKLMEFSFGFIMGGLFGFAAWLSRDDYGKFQTSRDFESNSKGLVVSQLVIVTAAGLLIYLLIPLLDPFVEAGTGTESLLLSIKTTIARLLVNYTFIGSVLVMMALRWPAAAFQLAITLTFTHTVIDLVDDLAAKKIALLSPLSGLAIVLAGSLLVSFLVAFYQKRTGAIKSLFMVLVWSTVAVAVIRMSFYNEFVIPAGHSFSRFIIGDLMVFNFFIIAALVLSVVTLRKSFQVYRQGN